MNRVPNQSNEWNVHFQMEMVLYVLGGESIDQVSRQYGIDCHILEKWIEKALAGMELGLRTCSSGRLIDITDH